MMPFSPEVAGIQDAIVAYNELISKKMELEENAFGDNTVLVKLKEQIDATRKNIKKSIGNITVYGPEESLKTLRASDIYAEIDLSELDVNAKEQTFTATINIENNNDCWAYGTYTITLVNQ
jgi:hypothetical protein